MTFSSFEPTDYLSARLSESFCLLRDGPSVPRSAFPPAVFVFLCDSTTAPAFPTTLQFCENLKEVK